MHPILSPGFASRRVLATLLIALSLPVPAFAHAVVVSSDPAAGASLAAAPAKVTIHFNSRLDHGRSRLLLIGAAGEQQVLPIDPDSDPTVLEAPLAAPGPGAWRLRWQVLAVDGHITRGDIAFAIRPR